MDPDRRRAARIATLVAVPVAAVILAISVFTFGRNEPTPPASTGPVEMSVGTLAADAVPVCQAVVAELPDSVAGQARRPVTAGAEQNAAYGDPPITLACGTTQPAVEQTATVYPLSGVCWFAAEQDDHTLWTTVDRTVPVTVRVPGVAEGSAQYVVGFSAAVAAGDPPLDAIPTGCR